MLWLYKKKSHFKQLKFYIFNLFKKKNDIFKTFWDEDITTYTYDSYSIN